MTLCFVKASRYGDRVCQPLWLDLHMGGGIMRGWETLQDVEQFERLA